MYYAETRDEHDPVQQDPGSRLHLGQFCVNNIESGLIQDSAENSQKKVMTTVVLFFGEGLFRIRDRPRILQL